MKQRSKPFAMGWAAKGVPPVVVDKIKPVLLADGGGVIKLSDAKETDIKTLLGDIFEAIPKVSLRALGDPTAEKQIDAVKTRRRHSGLCEWAR